MQLFVAILKSLLILFLLLLLLGSGACVLIDISMMQNFGSKGMILITAIAATLTVGAGYALYALLRSLRDPSERIK